MNCGLKKVYCRFLVRKPRSRARLKSDMALLRKPACRASSRLIKEKMSATAAQNTSAHGILLKDGYRTNICQAFTKQPIVES